MGHRESGRGRSKSSRVVARLDRCSAGVLHVRRVRLLAVTPFVLDFWLIILGLLLSFSTLVGAKGVSGIDKPIDSPGRDLSSFDSLGIQQSRAIKHMWLIPPRQLYLGICI